MQGLASIAIMAVAGALLPMTLNLLAGWSLDAQCPGTTAFCGSRAWKIVVEYLPAWLFLAQLLILLAMAAPFAIVRVRG